MRILQMRLSSACVLALITLTATTASAATITVNAGGNLQTALNSAQPGDTIVLQAGATFTGNFTLPAKSGAAYITIRSSAADASLPAANVRIDPRYASYLPKLKSANSSPVLATAPGAHHWRLQFLELQGERRRQRRNRWGSAAAARRNAANQAAPDRDRPVYIHGEPKTRHQARHRAQQRRHHDRQLVHQRHQGDRPGLAGDLRLERPRALSRSRTTISRPPAKT